MIQRVIHILFFLATLFLTSCSITRSVPEGAYLYRGAKVKIKKNDSSIPTTALSYTLNEAIKNPRTNKRFLWVRWGLRFHSLFHSKKEKGFFPWLQRNLGEAPVLYDEKITLQTEQLLQNRAINNGFFTARVTSEAKFRKKRARVTYHLEIEEPFRLANLQNHVADPIINNAIGILGDSSLLKRGQPYNLGRIKQERERIATKLRQKGYYFIQDDYFKFKADTVGKNRQIDLALNLKEEAPLADLKPQYIDKIFVYPDFDFKQKIDTNKDTLVYEDLILVYNELLLRPPVLDLAILFKKGKKYSLETHQNTLQRLSFLSTYQFVEIQFQRSEEIDSLIQVHVFLSPRKRNTIEGSVGLALKSSLYFGPEVSLTYINRNLFRGAEQLSFKVFGNFNFPISEDLVSFQETGFDFQLSKPGLILPFKKKKWSDQLIMRTKIGAVFDRQRVRIPLKDAKAVLEERGFNDLLQRVQADSTFAPFVALNNLDFSFGYQWRFRPDIQHELNPIEFILQTPNYEVPELQRLIQFYGLFNNDNDLVLNLEKMIIFKPNYIFLYDSRLRRIRKHNYFFRSKVAISGNKILSGENTVADRFAESQFFQLESDFRYFLNFNKDQTLAFRFATSAAIPFKDEVVLPFFDLYSVGGPNSIRAFPPRQVGPGSVEPTGETFFFTGTGDLRLESSIEFRHKLTRLFELGLFLDAGNVWLFQGGLTNNDLATFRLGSFFNQLAIGTGLGLRLDFSVFVLRFDLAFPLTKPWLPEGQRWVTRKIALGSASWRSENLAFNLAFGYPF